MCGASDSYFGLSEKKKGESEENESARRDSIDNRCKKAKKKDRALLLNLVLRDDGEGQASTMNG